MTLLSRRGPQPARAAHWPLTLASLLLLVVGFSALGPLLRGSGWWFAMTFVAAVVLCSTAVLRRWGVPVSVVPVAAVGVLLGVITLLFGNATGLLWILPSTDTFEHFHALITSGIRSIEQQSTPAVPTEGIVFLLVCGGGLIAILMDILAITLRWPALAGLPMLIPVLVPGVVVDGGAEAISLVLAGAAFLLLLRVDVRTRRTQEADNPDQGRDAPRVFAPVRRRGPGPLWGSVIVGSVGIVSALVLSTTTPALTTGSLAGSGSSRLLFGSGVSPMIDLGQDLRRPKAGPALHYTTTATVLPYFKLLTLDQFVGTTWTASIDRADPENTVDKIADPPGLSADVRTTESRTSVVIDGVQTNWLPAPTPATKVTGLSGAWYWDSRTRAIGSRDTTTRDQKYTVTALQLAPTAEQLRASSTTYPASVVSYLDLPVPRPEIIDQTAREVTSSSASNYDAAVAIQDYLRGDDFSYDTEAPVEDGYDGGGADVIGTFLEVKRGYCVHFASAMAIMARSIGIPSRIVLGYLPGSASSNVTEGFGRYNVSSHDLHSWPELYFTGIGWVPFEPTPGRGSVPDYATPEAASAAPTTPGGSLPTSAPRANEDGASTGQGGTSGQTVQSQQLDALLHAGLAVAILLAILLAPGVTRRIRRTRRLVRIRSGADGAAAAWAELTDTAIDHGIPVRDTETPRELAARLTGFVSRTEPGTGPARDDATGDAHGVRAQVDRLLVAEERSSFARPGQPTTTDAGAGLAADLAVVIGALHAAAERKARWRATVLPASLWPAVLAGRAGRAERTDSHERVELSK
ncbi:transglutaminase family protein [Glaciibacter sp. 2TAF33]|uniref:transglutaminase family protein n=1 Tax=Glaciibacter sp. 2TAF33 TaxID=3233015 RepID=UPI003F929803